MRTRTPMGARSAPGAGATGQMGGPAQPVGSAPGSRTMIFGDEVYLWILVALEVGAIAFLRNHLSRYHGG